jgi:hypothetical protein
VNTANLPLASDSGATFSADRRYRYRLWRSWGDGERRCAFVGVNPSTAGEDKDDPTIRREIGFARRWGFTAIDKGNLFALVSTDATALLDSDDPVGPDNDEHLHAMLSASHRIVLAWGGHPPRVRALVLARLDSFRRIVRAQPRCEIGTLGSNADGTPKHPLRLPYSTPWTSCTFGSAPEGRS